jgi:hypothetical protein
MQVTHVLKIGMQKLQDLKLNASSVAPSQDICGETKQVL